MAFLQLSSTNPKFSYILMKNPASGMLVKSNRKGLLFGWYSDPGTYNIHFRDSNTEVSYSGEDFEYMDATRYNSPMFPINAFTSFMNHMKKANVEDIAGYENTLIFNQMKCKPHNLERFKSNFLDYEFTFEEVAFRNYRIVIKTKNTIRELINLGQILAIFSSLLNNDLEYVSDDDLEKYMSCLQVIDSPYYIRHLFKCNFIRTPKVFSKYKVSLETSKRDKLELEFGNNLMQRTAAIRKHLSFKSHIVDIGCGEGHYVKEFAPKLGDDLEYHAIDTNPENIEKVKKLCKKNEINDVATWPSIDEFVCPDNSVILLTEVIEHMSREDAKTFLGKILQWPFKSLIITTPNKAFNHNYQLEDDDVRNEDHKFEMGKEEFEAFLMRIFMAGPVGKRSVTMFEIGDIVNGLQPTLAAIVGDLK